MDNTYQDCFVVFVTEGSRSVRRRPQAVERPVATCASYEDALRVRREFRGSGRRCVIRSVGQAGGGD